MNYAEIKPYDIANGPGVRVSFFVSGCRHHCRGCFNEIAWDFNYGKEFTQETVDYLLECLNKPYIKGITILGGEPLDPKNISTVELLVNAIRNVYGNDKSIWIYTGYTINNFMKDSTAEYILNNIDVLVDGPFIEEQKNLMLRFKGSENQRIIDMKKTIKENKIVLWNDEK